MNKTIKTTKCGDNCHFFGHINQLGYCNLYDKGIGMTSKKPEWCNAIEVKIIEKKIESLNEGRNK